MIPAADNFPEAATGGADAYARAITRIEEDRHVTETKTITINHPLRIGSSQPPPLESDLSWRRQQESRLRHHSPLQSMKNSRELMVQMMAL